MNKQYVIVGLGSFGVHVLEKLADASDQIIIIDREKETIEKYKDLAAKSYIADALSKEALTHIIPEGIDIAIVDVGDHLEAAITVTNTLKKINAKQIIVRADNEERGEILKIVGATKVIYPAQEAAAKIVPMLVSSSLFSFMPISQGLVLAETLLPTAYIGKTFIEADFRKTCGINIVAIRKSDSDAYRYFEPRYVLQNDDVLLCAGSDDSIAAFTGATRTARKNTISDMLRGVFKKKKSQTQEESAAENGRDE